MRYLPLTDADRAQMLQVIGAPDVEALFEDVPAAARRTQLIDLPLHQGEIEVERQLVALAARNRPAGSGPFFCGAGAYRHHVPASVDHLIQRSEFLTSYTPYQPESNALERLVMRAAISTASAAAVEPSYIDALAT